MGRAEFESWGNESQPYLRPAACCLTVCFFLPRSQLEMAFVTSPRAGEVFCPHILSAGALWGLPCLILLPHQAAEGVHADCKHVWIATLGQWDDRLPLRRTVRRTSPPSRVTSIIIGHLHEYRGGPVAHPDVAGGGMKGHRPCWDTTG